MEIVQLIQQTKQPLTPQPQRITQPQPQPRPTTQQPQQIIQPQQQIIQPQQQIIQPQPRPVTPLTLQLITHKITRQQIAQLTIQQILEPLIAPTQQ